MTSDKDRALVELLSRATPEEWRVAVCYCARDLARQSPKTLAKILAEEAERRAAQADAGPDGARPLASDFLYGVLTDVGVVIRSEDDFDD